MTKTKKLKMLKEDIDVVLARMELMLADVRSCQYQDENIIGCEINMTDAYYKLQVARQKLEG